MNDTHYFNLYTSGLGYLNRIREVTPKKGEPFLCCDIAALRGEASNAEHTWFDCRVSGKEAQKLVRRCIDACEQKRKVLSSSASAICMPTPLSIAKATVKAKPASA